MKIWRKNYLAECKTSFADFMSSLLLWLWCPFPCSKLENEDETGDPRTIDVVGNIEDASRVSNEDKDAPLPLYPDVLDHSWLLVIGISLRKNPCDGSSNFTSNACTLPTNEEI